MAETYSIQATLTAKDELSPVLDQVAKSIAKLENAFRDRVAGKFFDAIVKDANKAIESFGRAQHTAETLGATLRTLGSGTAGGANGRTCGRRTAANDSASDCATGRDP